MRNFVLLILWAVTSFLIVQDASSKTCQDLDLGPNPMAVSVIFDYKNANERMYPKLDNVHMDIANFKNIDQKLFGVQNVTTLKDANATSKKAFLNQISKYKGKAKIFQYSGHGMGCTVKDPKTGRAVVHSCLVLPMQVPSEFDAMCFPRSKNSDNYDRSELVNLDCKGASGASLKDYFVTEEEIIDSLGDPSIVLLDTCHSGFAKAAIEEKKIKSTFLLISSSLDYQLSQDSPSGGILAHSLSQIASAPDKLTCELDLIPDGKISDREIGLALLLNSLRVQAMGLSKTDLSSLGSVTRGSVPAESGNSHYGSFGVYDEQIPTGIFSDLCLRTLGKDITPACKKQQDNYKSIKTCTSAANANALSQSIASLIANPEPLKSVFNSAVNNGEQDKAVAICSKAVATSKVYCENDKGCRFNKAVGIIECANSPKCNSKKAVGVGSCRNTYVACTKVVGTSEITCSNTLVAPIAPQAPPASLLTENAPDNLCIPKTIAYQQRAKSLALVESWAKDLAVADNNTCQIKTQDAGKKLDASIKQLKDLTSLIIEKPQVSCASSPSSNPVDRNSSVQ